MRTCMLFIACGLAVVQTSTVHGGLRLGDQTMTEAAGADVATPKDAPLTARVVVGRLRCEYLTNPPGIDVRKPRLSWVSESNGRGQKQTAYQIVVAGTREKLAADEGDLWDSGKVTGDQSIHVEYVGRPLHSRQCCFWKVRVWDKDGCVSRWSDAAWWSMGLLERGDWSAEWIGYYKPRDAPAQEAMIGLADCRWIWFPEGDPAVQAQVGRRWFRRAFRLSNRSIVRAEALIAADDQFVLYINGRLAGRSDGRPDAWRRPRRIDVTQALRPGINLIAIEATNTSPTPAGLIGKLHVVPDQGGPVTIVTDDDWRTANTEHRDWTSPTFDDAAWPNAMAVGEMGTQPWGKISADSSDGWRQEALSPIFRREFRVNKPIARAMAYICGLGYHELHINGRKAGDAVLEPPFTRYDKRCLYRAHDVTGLLQEGGNAIGVTLGNGWYNVHSRAAWDFDQAYWRGRPKLLLQLYVDYVDGTSQVLGTDHTWRASTGPLVYDGIRHGEVYDARLEEPGWDEPGFNDAHWARADIVDGPGGRRRAAMLPPVRVTQIVKPVSMTEAEPGAYVFDFGQAFAGWTQLKVQGPAGTCVIMRYAERVHDDGSLDQGQIASLVHNGPFQTDTYILGGDGLETYEPRFVYHGFRYVELTGYPGTPTLESLTGKVVHTDFQSAGSFECSNELLNTIQRLTLWSYRSNFHGYPTDCPHREKNGWTGDAHLAAEQAMFNWHNQAAYSKWINDFGDEQRDTGELPAIVPTGGWGYRWGNGPAWDSAYLIIPWYMYLYRGDTRILEEHIDGWKRYVDYLASRAENGIVSIGLGDWAPAKTETPVAVTSTGYYYVDACIVAEAARVLGRTEDAIRYGELAEQIRRTFNETFHRGGGLYSIGSQTALSCAVYQGFADEAVTPRVIDNLVADIEANDWHIDTGILGAKYLFHVLSENRRHDVAYRLATQTTQPSYGWWVEQGATTLWEVWNGSASRNHIMYGDISAWFYRQLAGIQVDPENPGFKQFTIRPQPVGDLAWVAARHDSPYGRIVSSWRIERDALAMDVTIPTNTTATIHIPAAVGDITESGTPVSRAEGVSFLRSENGRAVFRIESGSYRFVSRPHRLGP